MGLQIESGNGNGQQAGVKRNRLDVNAKVNGRATYVSKQDGQCYFFSHAYDHDAGDTILWLTNISATKLLSIEKVHVASDTASQFTIHTPAYLAPAGSLLTGVNANRSSGHSADAVCYGDETNNVQGNVFIQGIIPASADLVFPVDGKVILGYHDCIAVDIVTAGTLAAVTIVGYFEELE